MFRQSVIFVLILVGGGSTVPRFSAAEEPKEELRLPELASAMPLRRDGEGLYLNLGSKGEVFGSGGKLRGDDAVKWVKNAGASTTAVAKRNMVESFVAVRADRSAPAEEVLLLAWACGVRSVEFRVVEPSSVKGGQPTEKRLLFARSQLDSKKALAVVLADPKEKGGPVVWQITRPGAERESVEPVKFAGRLKELLGAEEVVALQVGKSCQWSSVIEVLAACREAGVKEFVVVR
jgi:biopolymer transport protein ExbD